MDFYETVLGGIQETAGQSSYDTRDKEQKR